LFSVFVGVGGGGFSVVAAAVLLEVGGARGAQGGGR